MKSALAIYPNQLFAQEFLPDVATVFVIEEPLFFGADSEYSRRLHKQKIILHRASMRRYVEEVLWPAGKEVVYVDYDPVWQTGEVFERAKSFEKLFVFEPFEDILTRRLLTARRARSDGAVLEFLPNPGFYLKDQEVRQFFAEKHTKPFDEFYQWQRERFNVLIDDSYKPEGGSWQFAAPKQHKLTEQTKLPSFEVFGDNQFVKDATEFVNKHFSDNPGSTDFVWPTNHAEAMQWLKSFFAHRLEHFATHEQTLDGQAAWLYHSAISVPLNVGLLTPQSVVQSAREYLSENPEQLHNVELFVRGILGKREFVRGMYLTQYDNLRGTNPFNAHRRLTIEWLKGSTGIAPYDDIVGKVLHRGYAFHNERTLMLHFMMLAEIHPDDIHRLMNELFIDAYEWNSVPNVYGILRLDSHGLFGATAMTTSASIMQLSNYQRGQWSDVWDGLFLKFIQKHKTELVRTAAQRAAVHRFERLDADRKRIIGYRADDFLACATA